MEADGPLIQTGVLNRRGKRHTGRRQLCDDGVRDWNNAVTTKETQGLPVPLEVRRSMGWFSPTGFRGNTAPPIP